ISIVTNQAVDLMRMRPIRKMCPIKLRLTTELLRGARPGQTDDSTVDRAFIDGIGNPTRKRCLEIEQCVATTTGLRPRLTSRRVRLAIMRGAGKHQIVERPKCGSTIAFRQETFHARERRFSAELAPREHRSMFIE